MFGFGQAADQSAFAPKGQLTAIIDNWSPYYIERTQAVLDGTWKSQNVWHGLKEGMVEIAPYRPVGPARRAPAAADRSRTRSSPARATPSPARSWTSAGTERVGTGLTIPDAGSRQDGLVREGRAGLRRR